MHGVLFLLYAYTEKKIIQMSIESLIASCLISHDINLQDTRMYTLTLKM